jgi:hypothetical protein
MTHPSRRNLPVRTSVEVRMNVQRQSVVSAALAIVVLAGCNALPAGGNRSPSASASSSPVPGTTTLPTMPSASAFSSPTSPLPSHVSGPLQVNSAAQAAALVFASDPLFGSMMTSRAGAIGGSTSYEAYESGDGYSVSITLGSGDCPSSCIDEHTWDYSVSKSGEIELVSEQGDEVEGAVDHGTGDPATITVRLVAGPVCPVERDPPDPSCAARPVPDVRVIVRDPSGTEVAAGTAADDGTVSFTVPGGAYYVESAAVPTLMGQAQAVALSVPGGRSVTATMDYDTGIR